MLNHNRIRRLTAVLATLLVLGVAPTHADDGWVQLFNGKDLTGWKIPDLPSGEFASIERKLTDGKVTAIVGTTKPKKARDGKETPSQTVTLWRVENGLLIGGGPASHIFTERGDYENFHFRVEAKINKGGNSGQYFRTEFGPGFPKGYEAQINATHSDPVKTGSLYPNPGFGLAKFRDTICVLNKAPHEPEEFFTQEVIAVGPKITIIVNGKTTLDGWVDPEHRFKKGHFALQGHDPGSVMTFRKVEVKELK